MRFLKMILACCVLLVGIAGCASENLTQQTTQARTAYTAALQSVNVAYANGYVTSAQLRAMDPYRLAIDAALNTMQATATSDPVQWQAAYANFLAALADFNKSMPTTQP